MRYIKNKKFFFLLILLVGIIISFDAAALEVSWPTSPMNTEFPTSSISTLVKYFYDWGIALGGLAAFISLVIAGFLYLTSVGNPAKMQAAKDRAVWAIGGLALLLSSWLILNTINPELTTLKVNPLNLSGTGAFCDTNPECITKCKNECGTDEECETNCEKNEECSDMNQGDGKAEGMCFSKMDIGKPKSCTSVKFYEDNNFSGEVLVEIELGEDCKNIVDPRSARGFVDGVESQECMGTIGIYGKPGCGDEIVKDLPVYNTSLPQGRTINSVDFRSSF